MSERKVLAPKLRFPEFRKGKAWDERRMNEIYAFKGNNSLSRDKLNYEHGTIKNIHYGDIHTKFSTHFDIAREEVPYINESDLPVAPKAENFCIEGDLILADASEDMEDIGKSIEIIHLNGQQVVSGLHTILARQTEANLVLGFGGHLFKSKRVRVQIQKESQGAKVLGLAASRLAKVKIPFPRSTDEQEKIAACLSSLDELIAAQARKLDSVKAHRKGLMQQLFPREGEIQPRLRFPEFQSSDGWKNQLLGHFVEEFREKSCTQDEYEVLTSARSGLVRQREYFDNTRIADRNNVGFNVIPPNYITYRSRSDDRRFYFNENDLGITGIISTYYPVFRMRGGSNRFLIELLSNFSELVGKRSVGTSQTVLSLNELRKMELPMPGAAEQQCIADCFTSIDDSIAVTLPRFHVHQVMQPSGCSPRSLGAGNRWPSASAGGCTSLRSN